MATHSDVGAHPFNKGDIVRCHDAMSGGISGSFGKYRYLEYNCVYRVESVLTSGGVHMVALEGVEKRHRANRFKVCHVWKRDEFRPQPPTSATEFKVAFELTNDKKESATMALIEVTAVLKTRSKKGKEKIEVLFGPEGVQANSNEHADAIITVRLAAAGKLTEDNVQDLRFAHRTLIG